MLFFCLQVALKAIMTRENKVDSIGSWKNSLKLLENGNVYKKSHFL